MSIRRWQGCPSNIWAFGDKTCPCSNPVLAAGTMVYNADYSALLLRFTA